MHATPWSHFPLVALVSSILVACGGSGGSPECGEAGDCTEAIGVCQVHTCEGGSCGVAPVDQGTPVADPTAGDCHAAECDGAGNVRAVEDDADVADDDNACTTDLCAAGQPAHDPVTIGTPCATGFCNASGSCVECVTGSNCPSGVCNAGTCGTSPACEDRVKNGTETDVDCGGSCSHKCDVNQACLVNGDCVSGNCNSLMRCAP